MKRWSDEAWEAEIPKVKAMIDQFKAFQGKLGESARSLLNYLMKIDIERYRAIIAELGIRK